MDRYRECYEQYEEYGGGPGGPGVEAQRTAAPARRVAIVNSLAQSTATGLVLEIGSGRGLLAGIGGPDYLALDFSSGLLRDYLSSHSRVCASAEAIPLVAASCRAVFSHATLEHVPRPDLAFAEIDRVLAPGGIIWLNPAWHCRDWAADGLPVRPYRDLSARQRLRKALIPLRNSTVWRACFRIPWRAWRRLTARGATQLHYRPLRANYEHFWVPDSDACASIDSHEGLLFFESRGYEVLGPYGGTLSRLLARNGPVVARKSC